MSMIESAGYSGTGLALGVLGNFHVLRDDQPVELPQSRKTRALLAYLACSGRPHQRERLCEMFWDIPDDPRGALRWSLSKIRHIVGPHLIADRNVVSLDRSGLGLDYLALKSLDFGNLGAVPLAELEKLAASFSGPFLADMHLPRCPEFEAWRIALSDECEIAHTGLLRHLISMLEDQPHKALVYAHALKELVPEDTGLVADIERLRRGARLRAALPDPMAQPAPAAPESAPEPRPDPAGPSPAYNPPAAAANAIKAQVSVMAIDLVSPAQVFEMIDPEASADQLGPMHDLIVSIAGQYQGSVLQMGNGHGLIVFGALPATEDHALMACRAANEIFAGIAPGAAGTVRLRAGIDSGEVVLQKLGGMGGWSVSGAAPRHAQKLALALRRDGIALSARTRAAAGGYVRCERPADADISGLTRDEEAWLLVGENNPLTRWHLQSQNSILPFLAREAEMLALHAAWRRTRAGYGQTVGIVSEPGLGKSRLAHEFLDAVIAEGGHAIACGAHPPDSSRSLSGLRHLTRALLGQDGTDAARQPIEVVCDKLGIEAWHVPSLRVLLEGKSGRTDRGAQSIAEHNHRIGAAVREVLIAAARNRPIVVLFEDLHHVDAPSDALLAELSAALRAVPVLFLVTYRPEYRAEWMDRSHRHIMRLSRFTPAEAEEAACLALGSDASLGALRQALAGQCEGSPLYIEEAVRTLLDMGRIAGEPGSYKVLEGNAALPIPASIHALVSARLSRLEPLALRVLQAASIWGCTIDQATLGQLVPTEPDLLVQACTDLVRGEFLLEIARLPAPCYSVPTPLMRSVAVQMLLQSDRRALHEAVHGLAGGAPAPPLTENPPAHDAIASEDPESVRLAG